MLADDPDEALHQAELLLKQCSLTSYYDEVALKGLQLAANDALRGALGADKVDKIKENVKGLTEDLAHHEDRDPHPEDKAEADQVASKAEREVPKPAAPKDDAPVEREMAPEWQGMEPVLCVAGKGPLDEAAAAMLVQLLGKHGLGARVAPFDTTSRQGIDTLDVDGVAMVCVSYLEISGNPSGLHYLVRRLRQRLPKAKILVGLWPVDGDAVGDDRIRHVVAADVYASNLKDAVEACVSAAHDDAPTDTGDRRNLDGDGRGVHEAPATARGRPLTLVP